MSVEVRVPQLGESIVEATVGTWLKQEGDVVTADETLVQLETEKVNVDVAAQVAGRLATITHHEGDTVAPGDVLALVEDQVAGAGAPAPADGTSRGAGAPSTADLDRPHASPVARRMAEEHGINLTQVSGTGTGGRVTREDVERAMTPPAPAVTPPPAPPAAPPPPPAPALAAAADGRREDHVRMSRRRQTIAQRMLEAHRTAAMLTTFNEVDMTAVMELRSRRREAFQLRYGVGLGFMSFFTRAVVGALKQFERVNAEVRGDEIILKRYYDIGIAVGAQEGLVVPVVRDADRKSFAEIEREIGALAGKARSGTLTLEDLRGGTFTLTNGGIYGSLMSTPILSPPQVGILGMHKIQQRPMVVNGEIVARPMMYLALTYDHRIVDGGEAVQFLVRVKELIEDPEALLLEG